MRLYKREKLCSKIAIGRMFTEGKCIMAYPLRAVYRFVDENEATPARFMITIPKKKIRTAVGRVLLRRRTREAYRLNRDLLYPTMKEAHKSVDIAFIYLSKEPADYHTIEAKMQDMLTKIANAAHDC